MGGPKIRSGLLKPTKWVSSVSVLTHAKFDYLFYKSRYNEILDSPIDRHHTYNSVHVAILEIIMKCIITLLKIANISKLLIDF